MCPRGGDEFRREGSAVVRHLVSVRLTEASPVYQPGYIETSTAVRHLASQMGEDENDVAALAERGELRALFSDRHPVVIDVGATATEYRSDEASSATQRELELLKKLNEERAKRYGLDGEVDPLLDLCRRRNRNRAMRDPAPVTESRSQWIPVVS